MVDSALLEQVLQLDTDSRRELIHAVEDSLQQEDIPDAVLAEIDRRLAALGPEPSTDGMSLDDFMIQVRARHSA